MASKFAPRRERRDIVASTNAALSKAMLKAYETKGGLRDPDAEDTGEAQTMSHADVSRRDFVEPPESDPHGYERIIGESDLSSINYLDRGRRAAAAVCRIRMPSEGGEWYGTGFLVGPRLLMTNHHVLGSQSEAAQAEAEFCYEHDVDGVLQRPLQFNLMPHEIFFTDAERDVTFVALAPYSDGGVPIERFRWLPLVPLSGKTADKEWVTIIQHPNGGPKQISIRSSQIVKLDVPEAETFLHYLTDTEPGSSGSPVLNDQWQVVALHHKAVPAPGPTPPGEAQKFIGNEGVRISAIYHLLESLRIENPDAKRVLDRLEQGLGFEPLTQGELGQTEDVFEKDGAAFKASRWKPSMGYDPDFLEERIDFDKIYAKKKRKAAPLLNGKGNELRYRHFSVVVNAERKFAMLTAVNIKGSELKNTGARPAVWRRDPRMDPIYQPAGDCYEKNKGSHKVLFSRGHQVRRLDPCWGTMADAKEADVDTFHYTNAVPQVQHFNDVEWGNLEDYVLDRAQTTDKRLTVLTGPIFRENDPWYGRDRTGGPWQIPLSFWKIAVLQKTDDTIAAAAFILGQTEYVKALYEAKVFTALHPAKADALRQIQTSVKSVSRETGLDFSQLEDWDSHGSLESTRQVRWISRPDDIVI